MTSESMLMIGLYLCVAGFTASLMHRTAVRDLKDPDKIKDPRQRRVTKEWQAKFKAKGMDVENDSSSYVGCMLFGVVWPITLPVILYHYFKERR